MAIKIVKSAETGDNASPVELSKPVKPAKKVKRSLPVGAPERIVMYLATGYSSAQIQEMLKDEYGIDVSPSLVSYYDPRNPVASKKLKQEYKALFWASHRRFIERLEEIPMAHAATRLKRLEEVFNKCVKAGDRKSAINCVKESRIDMVEYRRAPDAGAAQSKPDTAPKGKDNE